MAQNEVIVKFKVDSDGGLKMVQQEAQGAADATENLTKKRDKYKRGEKGVSQQSANGTKNFSKMRDAIGGSGGLVSAYAALAANVFALSAAFNFLKRAADLSILQKSQESFAANSGVALQSVTNRLQEASGGMLKFRDAAQAAAIGVAKGFSPQQMEDLAEGARKASAALGRDFQDAFDRLVRGASKAEPELLDELGITLRLADATEKYGRAIGKNAKELTASERSQAVLLETQRQLNEMYGGQEAVSNPYQELAKTFDDLINSITQGVLPVFNMIATVLNKSAISTIAVFGALGVSIIRQMDFLKPLKESWGNYTLGIEDSIEAQKGKIQAVKDEIAEATQATAKAAQDAGKKSARGALKQGVGTGSALLQKMAKGQLTDPKQIGQLKKVLQRALKEYKEFGEVRNGVMEGANDEMLNDLLDTVQDMADAPKKANKEYKGFFKTFGMRSKVFFSGMKLRGVKTFAALGRGAVKFGKALGTAMKAAGIIGLLVTIGNMITQIFTNGYSMISGFLGGLSKLFNLIGQTLGEKVLLPVGRIIDFILNMYRKAWNGIVATVETAANFFGVETGLKKFEGETTAATDAMRVMAAGNVDLEASFRAMSPTFNNVMNKMEVYESKAKAVEAQNQRFTDSMDLQKEMGEDLQNVLTGLQDPLKNMTKAQIGMVQATYLGSAGISDQVKEIFGSITTLEKYVDENGKMQTRVVTQDRYSVEQREKLLKDLQHKLSGLGIISEQAFEALSQGEEGIATLANLEQQANRAIAAFNSMREAAGAVQGSIAGGNLRQAEFGIQRLREEALAARDAFMALGTEEGAAKAAEAMETYNNITQSTGQNTEEYYQSLVRLRAAQEANQVAAAQLYAITGDLGELRKQENELSGVHLQLLEIEKQLQGQLRKELRAQLELKQRLLEVKQRELEIGIITKEQGKEMGAVARAGDILEQGAIGQKAALESGIQAETANLGGLLADQALTTSEEEYQALEAKIQASKAQLASMEEKLGQITISDMVANLRDAASPMIENLKQLGPEGELMATVSEGALMLTEKFTEAFEKIAEGSFTMQDGLAMAASAVQALGAMQAAQGKAAVSAIDKQIAAEKKRDGKSKESVAKIQALEKKKEKIERKAFEQKKKAQMASVVISTASAIMKEAEKGFPASLPGIAMFTAMGAMQLSAIASQTYDGGSASIPSTPSKVSVGNRQNTVDLARAKSPSGELAYARGASGTGQGMTNFKPTPSFTGTNYRAAGGNTAFMVGEQGPELFVPDRPGTITPADETEEAVGGSPLNVNFTVNAIDTVSMGDMLLSQRGYIIEMIREAANASGETFIESVNVMSDQYGGP